MKVRINFTKNNLSSYRTSASSEDRLLETRDLIGVKPIKVESCKTTDNKLMDELDEYITPPTGRYEGGFTLPSIWKQLKNKVDISEAGALKYFKGTIGFDFSETEDISYTAAGTVLEADTDDKGVLLKIDGICFKCYEAVRSIGDNTLIIHEGVFYFKIPYKRSLFNDSVVEVRVDNYDKKLINRAKSFIKSNKDRFEKFKD